MRQWEFRSGSCPLKTVAPRVLLLDAPPCVTNDVAAVRSPMIVGRAHGVIRLLPKCDQYVQTLPRR